MKIQIEHDPDCEAPWADDSDVFMVTSRNRYFDPTPKEWASYQAGGLSTGKRFIVRDSVRYYTFPLYAYIHSGVRLSLGNFHGRLPQGHAEFDSGLIGFVLVKAGTYAKGHMRKGVESYVETCNSYLAGDVWYYAIVDDEGNVLDSCGGFIGREAVEAEAAEMLKYWEARYGG